MTGWIIAGAIILFLLVLLMTSVKVRFEYSDGLRLKINWLFVKIVSIPAKTKKMKRRDKKSEKDAEKAASSAEKAEESGSPEEKKDIGGSEDKSGGKSADKSSGKKSDKSKKPEKSDKSGKSGGKLTLKEIYELVKLVWDSLNTPLRRVLKATRIYGFRLNIVVGGDDAAKAAIKFGAVNMAAGSTLAFLDGCFTLNGQDFNITCDFLSEETIAECEFTAKLTVIAALAFLFWLAGRFIRNYLSREDAKSALNKLRK